MDRRVWSSIFLLVSATIGISASGCQKKTEAMASANEGTPPQGTPMPTKDAFVAKGGQTEVHPRLRGYVKTVVTVFDSIPEERKRALRELAEFVEAKQNANETEDLTYICTHDSRRSHMSQLCAAAAAAWYGVDDVGTFSGGTEATAFNPRAVAALERAGFAIENPGGKNPHYRVTYGPEAPVMECFSKKYDDPSNPAEGFAAVMTCSAADKSCPIVRGAALRVAVPCEDPKVADGTPEETQRYDERCKQIATRMFYLFSQVRT